MPGLYPQAKNGCVAASHFWSRWKSSESRLGTVQSEPRDAIKQAKQVFWSSQPILPRKKFSAKKMQTLGLRNLQILLQPIIANTLYFTEIGQLKNLTQCCEAG